MRQAATAEACVGAGKQRGSAFRCRQPRASIACCRWRGDMPLLKQVRSAILASKSPGIRRMPVETSVSDSESGSVCCLETLCEGQANRLKNSCTEAM